MTKLAGENEDQLTFEQAIDKLEKVVKKLESGDLSLNESLKYYQQGIELIKLCNSQLEETKDKIKMLTENEEGNKVLKALDIEEE